MSRRFHASAFQRLARLACKAGRLGQALVCGCLIGIGIAFGDGPADNQVENIRPVPPVGIEVPAEVRESLIQLLEPLKKSIEELSQSKDPRVQIGRAHV